MGRSWRIESTEQPLLSCLMTHRTLNARNTVGPLGFGSGCCSARHKPRWMNMSVCSEMPFFHNLLWRVWREITENDLCTCLLSKPPRNLNYLPQYFCSSFLNLLPFDSHEEDVALYPEKLCRGNVAVWNMPRVHDKLSVTLIIHTDAEDCPWRMTVSAALAVSVTNHQVIILLACKIASTSVTTFATHSISRRINTIYIWCIQLEFAESAWEEIWEK